MIRKAAESDLPALDKMYDAARTYMHSHGNPNQWNDGHPCAADLKEDIENGQLYIVEEKGEPAGAFVFYIGTDPTYGRIDQGSWKQEGPYGVAHKVVSGLRHAGIGKKILDYVCSQYPSIRMDTHADNQAMQKLLTSYGFTYCGIIYLANGDPRMAYQYLDSGQRRQSE